MRDTGEFKIEYELRRLYFEGSSKSGNKHPIFEDCNFELLKNGILKVGIKQTCFDNFVYIELDLKSFRTGQMEKDLKKSYRTDFEKGLYWFESMKD